MNQMVLCLDVKTDLQSLSTQSINYGCCSCCLRNSPRYCSKGQGSPSSCFLTCWPPPLSVVDCFPGTIWKKSAVMKVLSPAPVIPNPIHAS